MSRVSRVINEEEKKEEFKNEKKEPPRMPSWGDHGRVGCLPVQNLHPNILKDIVFHSYTIPDAHSVPGYACGTLWEGHARLRTDGKREDSSFLNTHGAGEC